MSPCDIVDIFQKMWGAEVSAGLISKVTFVFVSVVSSPGAGYVLADDQLGVKLCVVS